MVVAGDASDYVSDLSEAILVATKRNAGERRTMKVLNLLRYLEDGKVFRKFIQRDFPAG